MSSDEASAEHEGRARRRRTRTLVLGAVAVAIPIADIAFNLGAQNAVFFGRVLALWAVASAVTVSLLVLESEQTRVGRVGLLVMGIPTLAIAAQVAANQLLDERSVLRAVFVVTFLVAMAVALPYTLYVVASIIDEELLDLRGARIKVALIIVAVVVGVPSFLVGVNHRLFVTCDDFTVTGSNVPADCRDAPSKFIFP